MELVGPSVVSGCRPAALHLETCVSIQYRPGRGLLWRHPSTRARGLRCEASLQSHDNRPAIPPRRYNFYHGQNKESILAEELARRRLEETPLPPLHKMQHFINLTNGIEAVPVLHKLGISHYHFVRIQSTYCEQNNGLGLVETLDDNLLMHLALGHTCVLWDLGSRTKRRAIPRAQWYGAEFIKWYLSRVWFGHAPEPYLRGNPAEAQFNSFFESIPRPIRKRARYYRNYLPPGLDEVRLICCYAHEATEFDHDPSFYRSLALEHLVPESPRELLPGTEIEDMLAPTGYRLFIRGFSKKERSALRRELFGVARDLPQRERVEEEGRRGRGEDGEGEERGGGEVREVGGGLSGELFTETESEEDEVQGGKGKRERKRWEGVGGEM